MMTLNQDFHETLATYIERLTSSSCEGWTIQVIHQPLRMNVTHAEAWVEINGKRCTFRTNLFSFDVFGQSPVTDSQWVPLDIRKDVKEEILEKLFPSVPIKTTRKPTRKRK